MSTKKDCPICCLAMTKQTRLCIQCPSPDCTYECCRQCIKEYIVINRHDPKCMGCNKAYSRHFLQTIMPNNWLTKDFKTSREQTLFEREKSLIPATMPLVDDERQARNLENTANQVIKRMKELRQELEMMNGELAGVREAQWRLRTGNVPKKEKQTFIVKCPCCPAFLNKDYTCSGCEARVCKHCREPLILPDDIDGNVADIRIQDPDADPDADDGENDLVSGINIREVNGVVEFIHVCDKTTLESARIIQQECKPCPKCGVPIHKIEGCDQMWDPNCGTAFSWRTGQIVTGTIHNPHYFQYMRENGGLPRQPGDVPCGGAPDIRQIDSAIGWMPTRNTWSGVVRRCKILHPEGKEKSEELKKSILNRLLISNTSRLIEHVRFVETRDTEWNAATNERERVKYILKEMGENEYKKLLFTKERQMEKSREINQVLDIFIQVCTDILRDFVNTYQRTNIVHRPRTGHEDDYISVSKFLLGEWESTISMDPLNAQMPKDYGPWWYEPGNQGLGGIRVVLPGRTIRLYDCRQIFALKDEIINDWVGRIRQITNYCNQQFSYIAKAYKLTAPYIDLENDSVKRLSWQGFRMGASDPRPHVVDGTISP